MASAPAARSPGFGHSPKRIAAELALLVGGAAALVGLLLWLARGLSGWAVALVPHSVDRAIGEQVWTSLAPESKRCTNPTTQRYVVDLMAKLSEADRSRGDSSVFDLDVTVVDDASVNAFALPGGFVTVNMGLLKQANSGEEVAAVLAHELVHVTARHGTQRMLRQLGTFAMLSVVFGGSDIEAPASVAGSLLSVAYDRDQEAQADEQGLRLLQQAGLDAAAMASFFERLSSSAAAQLPELMSTHPDPGDRAAKARAFAERHPAAVTLPPPSGLRCH